MKMAFFVCDKAALEAGAEFSGLNEHQESEANEVTDKKRLFHGRPDKGIGNNKHVGRHRSL